MGSSNNSEPASAELKRCCTCKATKPGGEFWKSQHRCKDCQRKAQRKSAALGHLRGPPVEKRCPQCGQTKPSNQYYRSRGRTDGLNPWCIACTNLRHQQSYRENPARHRGYSLKRYSADAPARYKELYKLQGGRCAICGAPGEVLNLDHCHVTGTLRGLLCNQCNNGLGCFEDKNELMQRAVEYLNSWRMVVTRNCIDLHKKWFAMVAGDHAGGPACGDRFAALSKWT